MTLLPPELAAQLPPIASERYAADPMVRMKFFTPDAEWTWYVVEGSREEETGDFLFYGFVVGPYPEWGSFRLSELESVRGWRRLPVERDFYFEPQRFSEIREIRG
jgi:hypothetical protein